MLQEFAGEEVMSKFFFKVLLVSVSLGSQLFTCLRPPSLIATGKHISHIQCCFRITVELGDKITDPYLILYTRYWDKI